MERLPVVRLLAIAALTLASSACAGPNFEEVDLNALSSLCPEALETGDLASCNGSYHGVITIEASRSGGELTSSCVGEMTVTIDTDATPAIQGRGTCEFDGVLSGLGLQEGLVDGQTDGSELAAGKLWVGQDIRTEWDGGWDGFGAMQASFAGDHEISGIALEYRGSFEVWPEA